MYYRAQDDRRKNAEAESEDTGVLVQIEAVGPPAERAR